MTAEHDKYSKHLLVFEDKSEYHAEGQHVEIFHEGVISTDSKRRIKAIREAFSDGFLDSLISDLLQNKINADMSLLSETAAKSVDALVDSLTSEVGRALIGLSVMQLCIKSIHSEQNIRLHKGSINRASFSWTEGISMRTLDKKYVTPVLRKYDLLRLNADGFMMTRSLAENYPYTFLYKANMRGARKEWLTLVEELETGSTPPLETLKYLLSRLINAVSNFEKKAEKLLFSASQNIDNVSNKKSVIFLLKHHIEQSDYAARLLEIQMHSLTQAAVEAGVYGDAALKQLSQMRSANKKHGNIGDIELLEDDQIVESWDAKYGKGYLREEIEEAVEKLQNHEEVRLVGFVTTAAVERHNEIEKRIEDIEQLYSVRMEIVTFDDWVSNIYKTAVESTMITKEELSKKWFITYCEYLCQKRRECAPIDEPCLDWVVSLSNILKSF